MRKFATRAFIKMGLRNKVKVQQGTVIGGRSDLPNKKSYYFFKGIPYAKPPLGDLRFQNPVPLKTFLSPELDCTKEGDVSFQEDPMTGGPNGSENCLFLNIYTPDVEKDKKLPVMVFIHGGAYLFGSGNSDTYTPLYLMQEEVVVVTLNYRLGVLGFIAIPEANLTGNYGLKDQRLALQWVKENISQFNGDSDNITLFGESAGATSVHFHMLHKNSEKLFHKAIMQSGVANMPWAMQENPSYKATKLAKSMGCRSEEPFEVAKFLKKYSNLRDFSKHIKTVLTHNEKRSGLGLPMGPVIEKDISDAFVTKDPIILMNENNLIDIPVMMGYNSAEGIVVLPNMSRKLAEIDNNLQWFVPRNINLDSNDPRNQELAKKIRKFFFNGDSVNEKSLENLSLLLGDIHFDISAHVAAEIHSRKQHNSPLYFYRFDYVGGLNFYKHLFGFDVRGACHADELFYLFQSEMAKEPWKDRDMKMVKTTCRLWANFAKYGNPTPKNDENSLDCSWKPVEKINEKEIFNLNALLINEKLTMTQDPDKERMQFWRNIFQTYHKELKSKM